MTTDTLDVEGKITSELKIPNISSNDLVNILKELKVNLPDTAHVLC